MPRPISHSMLLRLPLLLPFPPPIPITIACPSAIRWRVFSRVPAERVIDVGDLRSVEPHRAQRSPHASQCTPLDCRHHEARYTHGAGYGFVGDKVDGGEVHTNIARQSNSLE